MASPRALLVAFFGGLVLIICFRLFWPSVGGAVMATGVAVIAIWALGYYYHRHGQTTDRQLAGDNLYYLGLLFTLASLIIALSQLFLFNVEGPVERRAYDLIGNFGIALVSTVAGIFGRILLQSSGENPITGDSGQMPVATASGSDDARTVLAVGAENALADVMALRLAVRQATDALSHFTRMTTTQSEQTIKHTETLMRQFNGEMAVAANRGLRDVAGAWQGTAQAMYADAEKHAQGLDNLVVEFNKRMSEVATSGLEEAAATWRKTAETILADSEHMSHRLNAELEEITARTEAAWMALKELAGAVTLSAQHMRSETADLSSMVNNAASASRGMNKFSVSLDEAQRNIGSLAKNAADAATRLEGSVTEIVKAHSALVAGAKQQRETALRDYKDAVSVFAENTREQLARDGGSWLAAVKEFTADGRKQQELGARSVEEAQRWGEQMSDEVAQWTNLAEHTRESLVKAVDRLTDSVRKS